MVVAHGYNESRMESMDGTDILRQRLLIADERKKSDGVSRENSSLLSLLKGSCDPVIMQNGKERLPRGIYSPPGTRTLLS